MKALSFLMALGTLFVTLWGWVWWVGRDLPPMIEQGRYEQHG
tara:strand:+ start:160 stop:285 length:126 start_codon:yes stop_codon:yes gene_type:complete